MHHPAQDNPRTLIAVILLIPVIVALALAAFAWPAARPAPRDLPLGLAGPAQAIAPIEQRLAQNADAFAIRHYPDEAAARNAIQNREIYGAIVASPDGLTVLTASAASPLVAQLLQQAVAQPAPTGAAPAPRIIDVVPADPADPRGAALASSILPLVLAGLITGVLLVTFSRPGLRQVAALLAAALLTGLVAVAIAQGWLGVIPGNWLLNASVLALTVLAIGSSLVGLAALLGYPGLALGAALMMFVGNPFSGISSAPELLPTWAGTLGQLLPPGAGGTLLRSAAFFDNNGATAPVLVLITWTLLGLAAIAAAALRTRYVDQPTTHRTAPVAV